MVLKFTLLSYSVGSRAHMTELLRIQQGPFLLEHCLKEKDWEFSKLCEGIAACSSIAGINVKELKSALTSGQ